jgi:hypothetical protein
MEMYLTANVLEAGIRFVDAVPKEDGFASVGRSSYRIGFNIFHSIEEATADAESQRAKKVSSLEKHIATLQGQMNKLKEMRFAVPAKDQ